MHRSRSVRLERSALFRPRLGVPTAISLAVALAVTGTGCAAQDPADPSSDVLTIALQDWQALDEAGQREALEADSRELGAFLIAASGLPDTIGKTAEEIEAEIPRRPDFMLPEATAPAEETPAQPTLPEDLDDIDLGDIDLGEFGLDGVDLGDIDMDDLEGMTQGGVDAELSSASDSEAFVHSASFVTAAHSPRNTSLQDAKGAAINEIYGMVDELHEVLRAARDGEKTQSYNDSDPEGGTEYDLSFDQGKLQSDSSTRDTVQVGGTNVTIDAGSNVDIDVCPNADGEVDGFFAVDGGVTIPGPDGAPVKTQITVTVELKATVDDDAWAVDSAGAFEGAVRTGTPNDSPRGMGAVTSTTKYSGTMTINYANDEGTGHAVRARTSKVAGDETLGAMTTKVVTKLQQQVLEEAEAYWRNGGCVRADVTESPAAIARGETSELEVVARRLTSPDAIPAAVAEYTGRNKGDVGGAVSPAGRQETPAAFVFKAEAKDGVALPQFKVTSRQGIGYGFAYIEVGDVGWVIEGEVNGTETYAVKCDGLVGKWEVSTTGGFGYDATSQFTIGEDLSGTFTAAGAVAGVGDFTDGGRVWFEARNGGYVFNIDGGNEANIPVRKATEAECGR